MSAAQESARSVGVDVGGTKIAAGVVTPKGEVLSKVRYPSAGTSKVLLRNIARAIKEVHSGHEVGGACLAVPGLILTEENLVVFSPNLPAIEGIGLKDALEEEVGLPLTVENDANAAAWGEFRFGSGREVENLLFLTLGTGIGGGVIAHGILMRGAQGAGGELGHVTVLPAGPRCACGNDGCLEALASGSAITRRAVEAAAAKPDSALGRLAAERKILGEDVTELARKGDEAAVSVLEEAGVWLGVALAGYVNLFDPEVVAIGGGVVEAGDLILGPARREMLLRTHPPSRRRAEVKAASLGPESGVLGAAALARDPRRGGEYVLDASRGL